MCASVRGWDASGRAYPRDCMRFTCIAEHAGEVMRRWKGVGRGEGRKRMGRDNEIEEEQVRRREKRGW